MIIDKEWFEENKLRFKEEYKRQCGNEDGYLIELGSAPARAVIWENEHLLNIRQEDEASNICIYTQVDIPPDFIFAAIMRILRTLESTLSILMSK
jgi:hypothetical protein